MLRYGYMVLAGAFFLCSCNGFRSKNSAAKENAPPAENYIVLLDLSDRILSDSGQQAAKDIGAIESIYNIFKSKLNAKDTTKRYYNLTDKLKMLGAPNWFYASIDLSAEQPDKRALMPAQTENAFRTLLPEIYKDAANSNKTAAYSGADIQKYFENYLTDDLDIYAQNTLFIITDGYMNPGNAKELPPQKNRYTSCAKIIDALKNSPDWEAKFTKDDYGLLPVTKKFSNLRVVVLQINPKQGWSDEFSLLTKIWDKWFSEMGISNYNLIKNDSANGLTASLEKLMDAKIDTLAGAPNKNINQPDSTYTATEPAAVNKIKDTLAKTTDATLIDKPAGIITKQKSAIITVKKELPAAKEEKSVATALALPGATKPATSSKKKTTATPDVLPPDESDTRVLNTKKTSSTNAKKTGTKTDDDILQDDGATNGFNTGIKKKNKKKKP